MYRFLDCEEAKKTKMIDFLRNLQLDKEVKNMWYSDEGEMAPKFLCDCFEAFVGALFLEGGFELIKKILDKVFLPFILYYLTFYPFILLDLK